MSVLQPAEMVDRAEIEIEQIRLAAGSTHQASHQQSETHKRAKPTTEQNPQQSETHNRVKSTKESRTVQSSRQWMRCQGDRVC